MNVGYEIDKLLVEPPEYWAYRIRNGRRVDTSGRKATEAEARNWILSQQELDRDDLDRMRQAPLRA